MSISVVLDLSDTILERLIQGAAAFVNNRGLNGPIAQRVRGWLAEIEAAEKEVIETCEPIQTERVTKSCEQAREEGISIIAIDMSGFNEDAEAITDLCMGLSDADRDNDSRRTANAEAQAQANTTRTLASGLEIEVSVDGESFSASVENLRQLREVLATMLPDAQPGERTVRLVS